MKSKYFSCCIIIILVIIYWIRNYFPQFYFYLPIPFGIIFIVLIVYLNISFYRLRNLYRKEELFLEYFKIRSSSMRMRSPYSLFDLNDENIKLLKDVYTKERVEFLRKLSFQILFLFAFAIILFVCFSQNIIIPHRELTLPNSIF